LTPYHVEVRCVDGIPSWELYYQHSDHWELQFERGDKVTSSKHSTLREASNRAEELRKQPPDPLLRWRQPGTKLLVCTESGTRKYSIIACVGNSAEDTGLRFNSEVEAREAAGGK
jgi:hypothetical protein